MGCGFFLKTTPYLDLLVKMEKKNKKLYDGEKDLLKNTSFDNNQNRPPPASVAAVDFDGTHNVTNHNVTHFDGTHNVTNHNVTQVLPLWNY